MDVSVNLDTDGNINTTYYKNASLDIITRQAQEREIDLKKLTSNQLRGLLRCCYNSLFAPDKRVFGNNSSIIPYTEKNIKDLLNIYIEICEQFSVIPSLFGFERYSGITEETTQKYVTNAKIELTKSRKDFVQNKLSETPIGVTVLANNDQDTGLMYNRQNMIERETVKQGLTLKDFVKISQKPDK